MRLLYGLILLCLLILKHEVQGQVYYHEGKCPYIPPIVDFNWDKYLGKWYEHERYFTFYEEFGKCWTGTYLRNNKNDKIAVKLNYFSHVFRRPERIIVDIEAKNPYMKPSSLTYTIPGVPFFKDHYVVAATDYDNWTVEYSCSNRRPIGHSKFAWILTRSPHPSEEVIYEAKAAMENLGIEVYPLRPSDKSCFSGRYHS